MRLNRLALGSVFMLAVGIHCSGTVEGGPDAVQDPDTGVGGSRAGASSIGTGGQANAGASGSGGASTAGSGSGGGGGASGSGGMSGGGGSSTGGAGGAVATDGGGDAACVNECTQGAQLCTDATSIKSCGNYDTDSCLEWSASVPCPMGQMCMGNQCVATKTCKRGV